MAEDSLPLAVRVLHATELVTRDPLDPVMPRQTLVDEGVVGVEELKEATVLADQILEEQLRFRTIASASCLEKSAYIYPSGQTLPTSCSRSH